MSWIWKLCVQDFLKTSLNAQTICSCVIFNARCVIWFVQFKCSYKNGFLSTKCIFSRISNTFVNKIFDYIEPNTESIQQCSEKIRVLANENTTLELCPNRILLIRSSSNEYRINELSSIKMFKQSYIVYICTSIVSTMCFSSQVLRRSCVCVCATCCVRNLPLQFQTDKQNPKAHFMLFVFDYKTFSNLFFSVFSRKLVEFLFFVFFYWDCVFVVIVLFRLLFLCQILFLKLCGYSWFARDESVNR